MRTWSIDVLWCALLATACTDDPLSADDAVVRTGQDDPRGECAALAPDECEREPSCAVITGLRYEAGRQCVHGRQEVGCMARLRLCPSAMSYARDSNGATWEFTSGCQPAGWSSFSHPVPEATPAINWPTCPDPTAMGSCSFAAVDEAQAHALAAASTSGCNEDRDCNLSVWTTNCFGCPEVMPEAGISVFERALAEEVVPLCAAANAAGCVRPIPDCPRILPVCRDHACVAQTAD